MPKLHAPDRSRVLTEVSLTSGTDIVPTKPTAEFETAGIKVRHVPVHSVDGFEYCWIGHSHYLALHDLHLIDGETFVDGTGGTGGTGGAGGAGDNRRKDLRGTMTFVPAGCRVWGWSAPRALDQSFTALYFDVGQVEDEVAQRLRSVPLHPMLYFGNAALRSTLEKLRDALRQKAPDDSLYLESLCLLAAVEMCVAQKEKLAGASRPAGRLARSIEQKIVDYVDANLFKDIGLNDLAQIAGLSRYHFLRSFKNTTNETPYQYLLQRRLERAGLLLKDEALSVAQVATAVGFKDATRFIRAFRRQKGVTPGKYR